MAEPSISGADSARRSEKKAAEYALRRSEAYLAIAQSLSHTGSFGWDIASGEIFWSLETYRIFELDPATKPTLDFIRQRVHPEDQELAEQIFARMSESFQELVLDERAVEKGDLHFEHRLLMPDGTVKYLRVSGRSVRDSSGDAEFVGAVTDITEAKKAEREARRREAKIRRLVDANIIGIGIWDSEGTTIEANDAFLKMLGYDRDDLNAGRMRWREMTPPEWLKIDDEKSIPELNATGRLHPIEKEFFRKDGTRVPVLLGAARAHDDDKERGVAFVLDLTDRKRVEDEVRASEIRFRAFVEHLSDALFIHDDQDDDGRVIDVNQQACHSLGYTREELIGMTGFDFDARVDATLMRSIKQRLARGEMVSFESAHRRKDGTTFPVEVRARSFWHGDHRFGLALVRDITERKRDEESLALRSFALNNVRESAYLIDEESRFHYVNEEACRVLGYSREELLRMCAQDVAPDFPKERWPEEWADRKSKSSITFETRLRTKDGSMFPVEINSNYFEYAGKAYILGLARDITERKRVEEATLEARVSERTRIARDLHDTLLQSFHGLLLRFQTVSQQLPDRPVEAKKTLDSAIAQAAEAITEGRDAVHALRESTLQRNDLAKAIRNLGEELANESTKQQPTAFHLSVEGEPRNLHPIIRDEIYKVSAEAMRNAFFHADAKQVAVAFHYEDEQVRVHVRDDGKGIDPEVLSRKASEGHYGIAGMRERANIIGGKLELRSELGGGTEIELCVPAGKAYGMAEKSSSFPRASSQSQH